MKFKSVLLPLSVFLLAASVFAMEADGESYMAKKTKLLVALGAENPYGQGSARFSEQSKAFIEKLVNHEDRSFKNWMYLASKERFRIAKENGTPRPERFGRVREAAFKANSDVMVDLEALTSSFSEFMTRYKKYTSPWPDWSARG